MTNHGDDCYFFYYSTCTKGDSCPFRHCEAAMGSETVCNLWQENRCFRSGCRFRHMEIKKNRKEIACYWEKQPGGCQKPHCAFYHEKPRFFDGVFVPPSRVVKKEGEEEPPLEDSAAAVPAPNSNPSNPQLRGVIKAETQENVPSPTHPPVVINPVDDDEDDDDQFSEEGEENSPRKLAMGSSKDDSLDFGIKTLEEIRLRKALKASLKKAGHPSAQMSHGSDTLTLVTSHNNGASTEKENIRLFKKPVTVNAKNDSPILEEVGKRKLTDRLGKRIIKKDQPMDGELPLKRSLAERLGGIVDSTVEDTDQSPQKSLKPIRERLGLTAELNAPEAPSSSSEAKSSGEIRIKTLEEIRQEKAVKQNQAKQNQGTTARTIAAVDTKSTCPTKRSEKSTAGPHVKTFSEILHAKKKLEEEQKKLQECSPEVTNSSKNDCPSNAGASVKTATQTGDVRVKTLEEIRKEKAARLQAQAQEPSNAENSAPNDGAPKRRILRISKTSVAGNAKAQKKVEVSEKKAEPATEAASVNKKEETSGEVVKVKTFEEIMREKRLRQQQEEQVSSPAQSVKPSESAMKQTPALSGKEQSTTVQVAAPAVSQPNSELSPQPKRPRISLKPKATSLVPVVVPQQSLSQEQGKANSPNSSPKKPSTGSTLKLPVPLAEDAPSPVPISGHSQTEDTQEIHKKSPGQAMEPKVRPKLNVKPSVVKPAAQVKPGQKRKLSGNHRSAVVAVKPLNTASAAQEEQLQEPPCKTIEGLASSSSADTSQNPLFSPSANTESEPSVLPDEVRPLETNSLSQLRANTESVTVPQSPIMKTTIQSKGRRSSTLSARAPVVSSSSTVDDFEELMNEFTDDRLEDEMELDPGKGEDDLLLELSEMIDS
ncbi:zinc finger CCCH domain-containing protein 11A [Chanos chanos]|uniref:Zinc finger CCCH domain-containing protein 11A n=1 Tax=Chanos chanos TaxID=29144 RepID=A0A6J2VJP2_CHACN|nr:zinc finger CCCH domain-containing protein 11A [Chanos chanos]XP_030632084.1 zinc finger CCCH domain-containing protein 11A [Chanos chanos]